MTYTIQHKDNDTVYDYSLNEKGKNTQEKRRFAKGSRRPGFYLLQKGELCSYVAPDFNN